MNGLSHSKLQKIIDGILYLGAAFMLGECFYHFSGIRMVGITSWPTSAISFSYFFMSLWASASLLLSIWLWHLARNHSLQKIMLPPLAFFAIFHAGLLWWWSQMPLTELWPSPNMYVWNPYYTLQLKFEAGALFGFGVFILWAKYRRKML